MFIYVALTFLYHLYKQIFKERNTYSADLYFNMSNKMYFVSQKRLTDALNLFRSKRLSNNFYWQKSIAIIKVL